MLKTLSAATIAGALALGAFGEMPARAAQGVALPGGDSLDFTPPANITEQQVRAAPRRDRRKIRAVQNGTYRAKRKGKYIAPPERGQ